MEYLPGGRENKIVRHKDSVHRPAGFWSKSVHALLNHVRNQGFLAVPRPLGFDDDGNEVLSYIKGEVSNYPLSAAARSIEALATAAKLLRTYHDASATFLDGKRDSYSWLLPPRKPEEVICHGDFAPYNVVLQGNKAVAIIDFDTAHPAPRIWDIAYAIYRWAPLNNPTNLDGFGTLENQIQRARLFCNSYDLPSAQRSQLTSLTIERMRALVDFMYSEAKSGNEAFQANIADGHDLAYLADIEYLKKYQVQISEGLF